MAVLSSAILETIEKKLSKFSAGAMVIKQNFEKNKLMFPKGSFAIDSYHIDFLRWQGDFNRVFGFLEGIYICHEIANTNDYEHKTLSEINDLKGQVNDVYKQGFDEFYAALDLFNQGMNK
ncbi:hypothetical protein MASRES_GEN12929_17475 [Acinetobacter baumannii]